MPRKKKFVMPKNKDMNSSVYELRKKVMGYVYEAKELAELPRITIRVTENHQTALALAEMKGNIIWVTEQAVSSSEFDLRTIVFHEILHAVFGVDHDESCNLMKSMHTPLTKQECHKLFKKMV
jgi:hypothetical protein